MNQANFLRFKPQFNAKSGLLCFRHFFGPVRIPTYQSFSALFPEYWSLSDVRLNLGDL